MGTIPRSNEDFTTDWLNEVLEAGGHLSGHRVRSVEARDLGTPGQTAEVSRLTLEYDSDDGALPRRMVAKYRSRNEDLIRVVIDVYQQYWREASFYTEFGKPGIAAPDAYCALHDPETQDFVLLLQDLAPAESPSWATSSDQVALATSHLPAFHAKWWNDDDLRGKEWLVQFDNAAFFGAAAAAAVRAAPLMREHFGDGLEHTISALQTLQDRLEPLLGFLGSRPFTLVHGDYHGKQLFFPTAEGGEFAVIDWQFPYVAQGPWDFARIVSLGQSIDARKERESDLMKDYRRGLEEYGIEGYARSDFENDWRFGLLISQMIMAIALVDTEVELIQAECGALGLDWRDVLLLRGEAAVQDWNVVDFLRSI